jgi:hypothetical protein
MPIKVQTHFRDVWLGDCYMPLPRIPRVMSSLQGSESDTLKPHPRRTAMGRRDTLNSPRLHLADFQSDTLKPVIRATS